MGRLTNIKLILNPENYKYFYEEKEEYVFRDEQGFYFYLNEYSKWRVEKVSYDDGKTWETPSWNDFNRKHKIKYIKN